MLEEIGQPKDIHYLNAIKYRKEGGERKWNTKCRKKGFKVEIGKRFRGCVRFYSRAGKAYTPYSW